jgi:hypothetical protein
MRKQHDESRREESLKIFKRLWVGVMFAAITALCAAQNTSQSPTLRTLMEGDQIVWGTASPDSGPIMIYDISLPEKTQIGTAKAVASDGAFSSSVNPPLVKGHQIVAVDQNGQTSSPVTVVEASKRPGPFPQ